MMTLPSIRFPSVPDSVTNAALRELECSGENSRGFRHIGGGCVDELNNPIWIGTRRRSRLTYGDLVNSRQ